MKKGLIIFTKNPELGKVKTRLAKTIGDEKALEVYKELLAYTVKVTMDLSVDKYVYYSSKVAENDVWDNSIYQKHTQIGDDLGIRMFNAFEDCFNNGYEQLVIIGSDNFEITKKVIEEAFEQLNENDVVFGPAEDGGYYLLGLNKMQKELFFNKTWSTESVLKDSLEDCKNLNVHLLKTLNDIDTEEDLRLSYKQS